MNTIYIYICVYDGELGIDGRSMGKSNGGNGGKEARDALDGGKNMASLQHL